MTDVQLIKDDGTPLDAECAVEPDGDHLAFVLESMSGRAAGREPRNTDYREALDLTLQRLKTLGGVIEAAVVDSQVTQRRQMPESERSLLDGPLRLTDVEDVTDLRRRLTRAQATVGQRSDARMPGNTTKRIRLRLSVPGYDDRTLEAALRDGVPVESASDAVDLLRSLAGVELTTLTGSVNRILEVGPTQVLVATSRSPEGQPVPITWVEAALTRLRSDGAVPISVDEVGHRSSFIGAVLKTLPGTRVDAGSPPVITYEPSDTATGLGTKYRPEAEDVDVAPPEPSVATDPDSYGNGLRAHRRLQNFLAQLVEAHDLEPRSPQPSEPSFDLAWMTDRTLTVVEVKSATTKNEVRQLRAALGQVLDYSHALQRPGITVQPAIYLEREPADCHRWNEITGNAGVLLAWPGTEDRLDLADDSEVGK
ncbi:hypothetical protein OWR29_40600 [Actinoplanes sp. Pm04-4]|uniref:Uncharacterized protein n=1 Tax=Paractinoplanes pyxinae TaxID=2997416 RepID=A0ABT4BCT8_9ACTN|nr:hypothetical protein [Actinoplanes pyxinae]MCY1144333.1 hypothetical protein [Actinoplanes pyxinae]